MGAGGGCVFSAPVVAILAYGYAQAGLAVLLLALVPILAAVGLLGLYREKTELARRLSEGNMAFALALVRALDARDPYTAGHSAAVAVYARDLARAAGYPPDEVAMIQLAALLHDVGKIARAAGDPDQAGAPQRRRVGGDPPPPGDRREASPARRRCSATIARLIRHHHERPDGRGYPDGLIAGQIPEAAAIIGLADAYSAMTSPRAYRPGQKAMAPELAIVEIQKLRGHAVRAAPRRALHRLPADRLADVPRGRRLELLARRPAPRDHGRDRRRRRRGRRRRRDLARGGSSGGVPVGRSRRR